MKVTSAFVFVGLMSAFVGYGSLRAEAVHYSASPASQLYLAGDSTLHKYKSTAQTVLAEGYLQIAKKKSDMESIRVATFEGKMTRWVVRVPVAGLKSEHAGLDENLQKAMNSAQYPQVVFKMTSYEADPAGPDTMITIRASGVLQVAGKSRNVSLTGLVTLTDTGFTLAGKKEILMSDYNVVPPVLFMGTVKTDDKIVIHFNLNMLPDSK